MLRQRLEEIFSRFPDLSIVMMGDFFIDQYFYLSRELSETSLETGLEAYQVTQVQNSLGAAGSTASNLCAMGVNVHALTMRGEDANGYVLQQLLTAQQIHQEHVAISADIFTPTYMKPMMVEQNDHIHELNRMDIQNRQPTSAALQTHLVENLKALAPTADAILVTDQVRDADCGVLTEQVREALGGAARQYPDLPIWVDSRDRGALFSNISLKTNISEAKKALQMQESEELLAQEAASRLYQQTQQPVLVTDGPNGIAYCDEGESGFVPALVIAPPIDIVGAGDSVLAGAGCALAAGASLREAALVGCLAGSVTIKKLGTTGTASVPEMLENLELFEQQHPDFSLS